MIRDHAWRRQQHSGTSVPERAWACAYLSCGRPREEHERAVWRGDVVQDGLVDAREAARS